MVGYISVSPTVFKWKSYRFFFFSREESRPHVEGEAKWHHHWVAQAFLRLKSPILTNSAFWILLGTRNTSFPLRISLSFDRQQSTIFYTWIQFMGIIYIGLNLMLTLVWFPERSRVISATISIMWTLCMLTTNDGSNVMMEAASIIGTRRTQKSVFSFTVFTRLTDCDTPAPPVPEICIARDIQQQ